MVKPRLRVSIAFAPADDQKLAVAVLVENAGFGSGSAAPIARRVFDYVLSGQYPSEEDIAKTQLGQTFAPIGTPRKAADVPLVGWQPPVAASGAAPGTAASASSAPSAASSPPATPASGASR